ncbi:protein indeterminate-domain 12 [Mercurialis annua]|uniref:protein indeterminate-domain 12 n=1 Tax=Mercurialis annua TaxID=3986 RepID=UPI002160211E|nr:protein indeterminate-domain 12 [Mercurialis annua]
MFSANMSNSTSLSHDFSSLNPIISSAISSDQPKIKKKRSLPGNPDPDAEVIALSPKTLLATNRFVCEICNKGFQRDQNLQLHRRGHNLPWKLKQRNSKEIKKKAYVCPEPSCVHHHPSRALGDLTGIKKHFCRKHGEKKWKCEKCSKIYAVQSDWKAHSKTCGTREYRCDCGTLFSRKDGFITHRAFCDALAEESARLSAHHQLLSPPPSLLLQQNSQSRHSLFSLPILPLNPWDPPTPPHHPPHHQNPSNNNNNHNPNNVVQVKSETNHFHLPPLFQEPSAPPLPPPSSNHKGGGPGGSNLISSLPLQTLSNAATSASSHHLSATALLQKAATMGASQTSLGHSQMTQLDMGELGAVSQVTADNSVSHISQQQQQQQGCYMGINLATWQKNDRLTRDFLGLTSDHHGNGGGGGGGVNVSMNVREMLTYTGGVGLQHYGGERDCSLLKPNGFGFGQPPATSETWGDC